MKTHPLSALCLTDLAAAPALAQPRLDPGSMALSADANGDGVISREEFLGRRADMFDAVDADGSGSLDQNEFTAILEGRAARFSGRAMKRFDTNGDGIISRQEWDSAPAPGFDRADRNDDGVLSGEELSRRQ